MPLTIAPAGRPAARHVLFPPSRSVADWGRRVLLADPCRDTIESLGWLLRAWGFDVRTASNGPAALAAATDERPDAVVVEIGLPRINGWEVARRLRERGDPGCPLLLAVSGYGSDRDRARSREAGFDGHMIKPACPVAIRAWLDARLAGREVVR